MDSLISTRAAIFLALADGPGFGTQIIDRISRRTQGEVELLHGSIYPALHAMERDGFIESHYELPEKGGSGRLRRVYELTTSGRERHLRVYQVFGMLLKSCPDAL